MQTLYTTAKSLKISHFDQLTERQIWDKILEITNKKRREPEGKDPEPTVGISWESKCQNS
jgi:hypothetical protein